MFRYSGYSLTIHSEIELPELPPGGDVADLIIQLGRLPRGRVRILPDEDYAFNTDAGGFLIRYGREITVDPLPGANPDTLRTVLLGRMMAFLLRQRGWLPLHASGVVLGDHAVLFLGASGAGKSTTAAGFHLRGHRVIADDVSAVRADTRGCLVCPAGPRLRLASEAVFRTVRPRVLTRAEEKRGDKDVFDVARGHLPNSFVVKRIYLLDYDQKLRCETISTLQAIPLLSENCFAKRHRMKRDVLLTHFRDCTQVAHAVSVRRLLRTRSLDALSGLVDYVEGDLATE